MSRVKLLHMIPVSVTEPILFKATTLPIVFVDIITFATIVRIPDKFPLESVQS